MYSTNNSRWRQELTPYNQYEEERALDLDIVFAEFMAYHASSKANHNAIQKQEIQCAKVFFLKIIKGNQSHNSTIKMKQKGVSMWTFC